MFQSDLNVSQVHKVPAEDHAIPVEVGSSGAVRINNANIKEENKPAAVELSGRSKAYSSGQAQTYEKAFISPKKSFTQSPLPSTSTQSNVPKNVSKTSQLNSLVRMKCITSFAMLL